MSNKSVRRATMIARDQRALLRRVANIYPGPGGGMDPGPGGGGYAGPGGGKYIGPSRLAVGGRADENDDVWWHGSGSGDLRGGKTGLHLGTRAAAEDALNARIGIPVEGSWDGTREYGKTKLAGKNTILKRNPYDLSGHNATAPDEDYFPHEHPDGMPAVSGQHIPMEPHWKPNIAGYRIKGVMTNTVRTPHGDWKANGYMKGALKRGNAKRGYFYRNEGEDAGSISAVVPSGAHVEPLKRAAGGPTEAQKHAGNYKKQHLSFHGLPIAIETAKGETREGVDPNGKPWSVTMPADYGYIKRTEGADGDHVDVYLGPDRHSQMVFLINQHDHGTGKFDEHKVMLGYTSERAAVEAYDKGFSDGKGRDRIGSVEPMSLDAFKHWLKTGKTTKPAKATYIVNSRIARASGGEVPPFKLHSGAAKLIAQKGQAKATPQQYAAMPGIKPDELKHAKFDTLGSKSMPREEVVKHLRENAPYIEDIVFKEPSRETYLARHEDAVRDNFKHFYKREPRSIDELLNFVPRLMENEGIDERRHAAHQIPGGDNYREVLLQLPPSGKTPEYISSHWDQPNVLAHIRMSDRKGPNGEKVLHVEEVQSDWGQQGREEGFRATPEEEADIKRRYETDPTGTVDEYNRRINDARIPRGPYVDNTQKWTDLALKRVLHEAAHGGYDKVVFTPGDEQNKRYSLSKQIRQINWSGDKDDRIVTLQPHHGNDIEFRVLPDGKVTGVGGQRTGSEFDGRAIHEVVGKEIGDKIMAARHGDLSGSGLEVGGAGMRGYYDNILPKRLQALAQQHDPKAKVQLGGHKLRTATESPLRQRIRDAGYEPDEADVQTMLADNGGRRPSNMTDADLDAMERGEHLDYSNPTDTPLHSLDVTPQMRDSIKQNGFSQVKRGGYIAKDRNMGAVNRALALTRKVK